MEQIKEEEDDEIPITPPPKIVRPPRPQFPDPVRKQKHKDARMSKKEDAPPTKVPSDASQKIEPTLSTRIGLQKVNEGLYTPGEPRPKYIIPMSKWQKKFYEKNRAFTSQKYFCKYETVKISKPTPSQKVRKEVSIPSPETSQVKVAPRRATPTASMLYPFPQTESELALMKPKSGIFINVTKGGEPTGDYDSFDLVYTRTPRPEDKRRKAKKRKRRKAEREGEEDGEGEGEGEDGGKKKKKRKRKKKKKSKEGSDWDTEAAKEEEETKGDEWAQEQSSYSGFLMKQFRRKVSQHSATTSYQTRDFKSEGELIEEPEVDNKFMQKFRRESEIKQFQPRERKIKRGTLESHSFTNINQPILKDFYFGCRQGTMHQGDESFPASVRNQQGFCMPVAAYCYSIIRHPNKWTTENIDEILEYGNKLCLESIEKFHLHEIKKELKPDQLQKYCTVGFKKVRFVVDDPEIVGYIRSEEKIVYNLTKGLKIFFNRNNAGILKTQEFNVALWKDKYYYMFDARPRTKDLYYSPETGTALMANFYDIPSLVTVFLNHSNFGNWPFAIYPIKAMKILNKSDPEVDSKEDLTDKNNYIILNEKKGVLLGTFDLGDKCFGFSRGKQSLPMAVVSLVYSRITPPSAWRRSTVDKIMLLGNQLYVMASACLEEELRLDNLPALFTIGPYIVEIYIYGNIIADLMYQMCCCQLNCALEDFFKKGTNAIIEIGKKKHIAVWQQRNMFYYFDPYSRNSEGYQCRNGAACVSMHSDLQSLVDTIACNFDQDENVFYIHALKVCKIHRDPAQSLRFPRHIPWESFPVEDIKNYKMKKSKKAATEQPVSVDYTALAMIKLLAGEEMTPSIREVGSTVESLKMDNCLAVMTKKPSQTILREQLKIVDVVADLDSPSLTDTQVPPPPPQELRLAPDDIEFLDMDSFELTMEEIEFTQAVEPEGEGEDDAYLRRWYQGEDEGELEEYMEDEMYAGEDDWYWAMAQYAQAAMEELPTKISEEINTEITYFPIKREILYPTYLRGKQQMKYRLQSYKFTEDDWDVYLPPEPTVTQSQELQKETNFIELPDNTEIIRGTKNVAEFGKDIEFIAPFICIMAGTVSRKYSILTWTPDIVDYILKCGNELYAASKFRYDQVSKLEIQKIALGEQTFSVLVEYIFDTYTRQNILELAIEKILFVRSDVGILVTPVYACALFYKNHLYYMYDCFGNNEVGLSEGPSNEGTACFSRFKDIHSLASRIMYNKRKREQKQEIVYSRFVLSTVKVKELLIPVEEQAMKKEQKRKGATATADTIQEEDEGEDVFDEEEDMKTDEEEEGQQAQPTVKVGYKRKDKNYIIEGSKGLVDRNQITSELKEDHFICLVACLMLISCPIKKWDNKRVDQTIDNGKHIFNHADDLEFSEKRIIKNILVDKHFFDIIVKRIKIENWKDRTSVYKAIDTLLSRSMSYFLVQFPNACYVIHKSNDDTLHLFDPYDVLKTGHAGWLRCKNSKILKKQLKKLVLQGAESFQFYNFEVTSIQKAPKEILINFKLMEYNVEEEKQRERFGKTFYEDVEWLKLDPIPWTRRVNISAQGRKRGLVESQWKSWDIEYSKDLFSLMGHIHQNDSTKFSEETRGKQSLANLVVCIGMMEIYELAEWNAAIVDSVLVNGDNYFRECIEDIKDDDYEISMDDLKPECSIFPFSFNVTFNPIVEGTMFLVRTNQFNMYKALRYFFNNYSKRCGVICSTKAGNKRQIAFGKLKDSEYFMFDCELTGGCMFLEGCGVAYILRMTTLNRLLHVITLTLRGGDFYIYEVEVTDLKPIN